MLSESVLCIKLNKCASNDSFMCVLWWQRDAAVLLCWLLRANQRIVYLQEYCGQVRGTHQTTQNSHNMYRKITNLTKATRSFSYEINSIAELKKRILCILVSVLYKRKKKIGVRIASTYRTHMEYMHRAKQFL